MNVSLLKTLSLKLLTTAIAISSALALSACGGGSDSSGDKEKDNVVVTPHNSLDGFWKSTCMSSTIGTLKVSRILFMAFSTNKQGNVELNARNQMFQTPNCSGESIVGLAKNIVPKKAIDEQTNVINSDNIEIRNTNEESTEKYIKYSRISSDEFNNVK